ncbi:hypothetical protein CEXT_16301 [Caerostris extrusa]|uniref:Uncharacterized protein n=1 Tax=Caerostris extrusa TaxID=172846 RepID=A0AAV4UJV7_CAEEX|nr:hypothetical protein CEXT_16301 [Caerostris extrusa]
MGSPGCQLKVVVCVTHSREGRDNPAPPKNTTCLRSQQSVPGSSSASNSNALIIRNYARLQSMLLCEIPALQHKLTQPGCPGRKDTCETNRSEIQDWWSGTLSRVSYFYRTDPKGVRRWESALKHSKHKFCLQ